MYENMKLWKYEIMKLWIHLRSIKDIILFISDYL